MNIYHDRQEAGRTLALQLQHYAERPDTYVLALPRGGVPVAFEVAKQLHLPLDVFIVRKLGVPGHIELAMGALAMDDVIVFNEDIIEDLNIPESSIQRVIQAERIELSRREQVYRDDRPFPSLQGKTVILVDDGIATGATIRAAIQALRQLEVQHLVVAVPVAQYALTEQLAALVDELICPLRPVDFYAVGIWYENFSQTEDEEVHALLNAAQQFPVSSG